MKSIRLILILLKNKGCFTLMHHVAGELGQVAILFQPNILKTYSRIWETEYEICDVSRNFIA